MTLPRKPTVWFWLILTAGLLFGSIAATATAARGGSSAWVAGLQTGLLAATLVAAFWYALVTHRLLVSQRDASEIAEHPWLHVSAWPISEVLDPDQGRPLPIVAASLRLKNVGRAPALLQSVAVSQPPEADASTWKVSLKGDGNPRALAPGQGFVVDIADIQVGVGARPVYIDVSIDYLTVHGGKGWILLRFRYAGGSWKSRQTRYDCTLSSGVRLPRQALADAV
jgi:hypothetical protein